MYIFNNSHTKRRRKNRERNKKQEQYPVNKKQLRVTMQVLSTELNKKRNNRESNRISINKTAPITVTKCVCTIPRWSVLHLTYLVLKDFCFFLHQFA